LLNNMVLNYTRVALRTAIAACLLHTHNGGDMGAVALTMCMLVWGVVVMYASDSFMVGGVDAITAFITIDATFTAPTWVAACCSVVCALVMAGYTLTDIQHVARVVYPILSLLATGNGTTTQTSASTAASKPHSSSSTNNNNPFIIVPPPKKNVAVNESAARLADMLSDNVEHLSGSGDTGAAGEVADEN
jgi:hypothetical protein